MPKNLPIAMLGFSTNNLINQQVDLYDLSLHNWDINNDWKLKHNKYNSIVCTRCPYFAKNPEQFIINCHEHLIDKGEILIDFGLGDHWRFEKYKVGWVKDDEQEWAYFEGNFLWSTVWDDAFLENEQFKLFTKRVKKFNYTNVKQAIFDEVPSVLELSFIRKYFDISYELLALWEDYPQLYIFITGTKKV